MLRKLGKFVLFALVYFLPLILDFTDKAIKDPRVRALFNDALAIDSVRSDLLLNISGHILLIGLVFAFLDWIAGALARRLKINRLIVDVFVGLSGLLLIFAANSYLFPFSQYSIVVYHAANPIVILVSSVVVVSGILSALHQIRFSKPVMVMSLSAILCIFIAAWSISGEHAKKGNRNVIIVGIDSLSDQVYEEHKDLFPNIKLLLESSTRSQDAYTPLGRTYPAWVSILSGLSPAEHGAIYNLRNMDVVDKGGLVSTALQRQGYRTVFAIDERRFANIDESFGFDVVVGPKAGALDFVLQRFNDTPLSNLLLQVKLSGVFFGYSRINTASHANYDAMGFVESVVRAAMEGKDLFLAVHFETAHFPFKTRHATVDLDLENTMLERHIEAVTAVDRQVGVLIDRLREIGRLDNALLVVLSDHGEGLGEIEFETTVAGEPTKLATYGHGANLLSDHSNRIVLGFLQYKNGVVTSSAGVVDGLRSLLDLRGVIERYASNGELVIDESRECMFVETGIRFSAAENFKELDFQKLASQSAEFYEIDERGRMRVKENRIEELVNGKDVGVRCEDRIAYYSSVNARFFGYRFNRSAKTLIEVDPDPSHVKMISNYYQRLGADAKLQN